MNARSTRTLLVSIGAENTQVCLVQNGAVTQAAVLGTGIADLQEDGLGRSPG